jgi:hypothetical protein
MNTCRVFLVCSAFLLASAGLAQNARVSWWAADMGAGTCRGTNAVLTAIIGQRGIGFSTQGNTTLMGGFLANSSIWQALVSVPGRTPVLQTYVLEQNYPNPFNPKTVVSCQSPVASRVRLVVYDLLGREVKVLMDEKKEPGRYQVEFDGAKLSSGMYIYRLTAGNFVHSKRMMLLK